MRKIFSLLLTCLLLGTTAVAQQQIINVGSSTNDGTGDPLRTAGTKINANFSTLFTQYDRTPAEIAAGVTPTNYGIPSALAAGVVYAARYGATTSDANGGTNAAAINNALAVANQITGGAKVVLGSGNFNINAVLTGYTNTYLVGQGMAMGNANPDFSNGGGTTITQLSSSADVIDFVNTSSSGLRDVSLATGSGGNGVMWEATSGSPAYFMLQNVSVNLGANSAGIGVYLNNSGSTALFFPRFNNVVVTGQSETAYGTKIGIRIGNPAGTSVVTYGDFDNILVTGTQIGVDCNKLNNGKFSGIVMYNLGNTGIGLKGSNCTSNQFYGVNFEEGTVSGQYINWSSSSNDNLVFMNQDAMTTAQYADAGLNNQLLGDDGSGGITNKFGMALNLFDVRKLTINNGLTETSSGVACSMSAGTSCTATVPLGSAHCAAYAQGSIAYYAACSVSGTTATVTANASNSATWLVTATQ